jgi:hypothetical protein
MNKLYYVAGGVVAAGLCALVFFFSVKFLPNSQQTPNGTVGIQPFGSNALPTNNQLSVGNQGNSTNPPVENNSPNDKFTEFNYQDPTTPNLSATVYLPESAGQWGVQNPYKSADQSLTKSPQVFIKAAFQDIANPTIYGLIRVVYDLQGTDCYIFFTGLAQLDGLRLQTYTSTTSNQVKDAKSYVFEYYQDQRNLLVGSKVVCDEKYGLELFVVAPDQQLSNGSVVQSILQHATLTIPDTTIGAVGQQ